MSLTEQLDRRIWISNDCSNTNGFGLTTQTFLGKGDIHFYFFKFTSYFEPLGYAVELIIQIIYSFSLYFLIILKDCKKY